MAEGSETIVNMLFKKVNIENNNNKKMIYLINKTSFLVTHYIAG